MFYQVALLVLFFFPNENFHFVLIWILTKMDTIFCSYNKKNLGRAKHHPVVPERNPMQKGNIQNREGRSGCTTNPHRNMKTEKNNSPKTLLYRAMQRSEEEQTTNVKYRYVSSPPH
jgi:hypothetical protein